MSGLHALRDQLRAVVQAYEDALNADSSASVRSSQQQLRELRHQILPRLDPSSALSLSQALAIPAKRQAPHVHWPVIDAAAAAIVQLLFAPTLPLKHLLDTPDSVELRRSWNTAWERWRKAFQALGELESLFLIVQPGQETERLAPVRRGRKPQYDSAADEALAAAWEQAKAAGVDKKQFCRDRSIRVKHLDRILDRVRKRRMFSE